MVSTIMLFLYSFFFNCLPTASSLVINDGVGKLPALGWNSWNAFHCDINWSQIFTAAEKMVELGLKV